MIHKFGQLLGNSTAVLGVFDLAFITASATVSPVYAIGPPPISVSEIQQWAPVVGGVMMAIGGSIMSLWFRFTGAREERMKSSFRAELGNLNQQLVDIRGDADAFRGEMKSGIRGIREEISDIKATVADHEQVIEAAKKRSNERAKQSPPKQSPVTP